MLRLIHTSDVHIGVKLASFRDKAAVQRQSLLDVFAKIVDTAISEHAQLLLIAGDLFDSNFPSYQSVQFVKGQLGKLNNNGIYVAIAPGTHDCLSKDSIFLRENFTANLPYIYVFNNPEITVKEFPDIDVTVFTKANISNKSTESPIAFLAEASKQAKTKYKVAMAHGSVQIEGKSAEDDLPISLRDIAESGMDYLALGHWHGAQEFSFGGTKAWYAGSPEITYQEGKGGLGQGYALMVDMLDKVEVKPFKVSDKEIEELHMDMQVYENMENVYYELEKHAGANKIITVSISGVIGSDIFIDEEKIEEDFKDKFLSIRVTNNTVFTMDEVLSRDYPEELVIGQFMRIMRQKIESAQTSEEKKIAEDAMHLGIAELEGKNIIE